jgi:hypothetical protein
VVGGWHQPALIHACATPNPIREITHRGQRAGSARRAECGGLDLHPCHCTLLAPPPDLRAEQTGGREREGGTGAYPRSGTGGCEFV